MIDQLAVVRDDPRVLIDGFQREDAPPVHAGNVVGRFVAADDPEACAQQDSARLGLFESPLARITIIIGAT